MPDISEIGSNLGFIFAPVACILCLLFCSRLKRRWLKYLSIILFGIFSMIALLSLIADCYFELRSSARIPGILSPDGKHVALVRWVLVGAIGFL